MAQETVNFRSLFFVDKALIIVAFSANSMVPGFESYSNEKEEYQTVCEPNPRTRRGTENEKNKN